MPPSAVIRKPISHFSTNDHLSEETEWEKYRRGTERRKNYDRSKRERRDNRKEEYSDNIVPGK